MSYNFKAIDSKWQSKWEKAKIFSSKESKSKKKFYCLEMFPYPSGKLHMGHVKNYSIGDCFARFKRMQGFNVLYPMGYDALGLPAENAAIKNKVNPRKWTFDRIKEMKEQQKLLGLSYDWSREIATADPSYYKWNQWIFLQFLKKGLAYKKKAFVNWCNSCGTVLANEQVVSGKCWRCHNEVIEKELDQWFFRITAYADELLSDISKLEHWPEKVKAMQRNWIGKSSGILVDFSLKNSSKKISVFTTRPDTLYGVTFMALAPEHPLVLELPKNSEYESQVKEFVSETKKESIIDRINPEKEKKGQFIGAVAVNPLSNEEIPLFVANFAIMEYGTGIVMGVPCHDQRDFEFAKKYDLPLKVVIQPSNQSLDPNTMENAFVEEGILTNSGQFNNLSSTSAIEKISSFLESNSFGKRSTLFKIRDWLISRQRFWGTPIPVIYCNKCGIVPVPESHLPVLLPENANFSGSGNPLESVSSFVNTKCPKCKSPARRETDTMDTFVDSSWYFFRFTSPSFSKSPFDKSKAKFWLPVDQYIGGIEHATGHLIYSRFFTKVFRDLKLTNISEPFSRLLTQGMILKGGKVMSKSSGNIVDPGDIISKYGADTARHFILSVASPDKEFEWSDKGVDSSFKFLNKVYSLITSKHKFSSAKTLSFKDKLVLSKTHRAIENVTNEIEFFQPNTALMEISSLVNLLSRYEPKNKKVFSESISILIQLLSPFAPHLCEELWSSSKHKGFVSISKWPSPNKKKIDKEIEALDDFVQNTVSDIRTVLELAKISKPKKISLFVAEQWKYDLFKSLQKSRNERDSGKVLKTLSTNPKFKSRMQDISKFVPRIVSSGRIPEFVVDRKKELSVLKEYSKEIGEDFGCKILIINAEESSDSKARQSLPGKAAILVE